MPSVVTSGTYSSTSTPPNEIGRAGTVATETPSSGATYVFVVNTRNLAAGDSVTLGILTKILGGWWY